MNQRFKTFRYICLFIFFFSGIAEIVVLSKEKLTDDECSANNIWYCILCLCIVHLTYFIACRYETRYECHALINAVPLYPMIGFYIWSHISYYGLSDECMKYMVTNHVIILNLVFAENILFYILIVILVYTLFGKIKDQYEEIDDINDEEWPCGILQICHFCMELNNHRNLLIDRNQLLITNRNLSDHIINLHQFIINNEGYPGAAVNNAQIAVNNVQIAVNNPQIMQGEASPEIDMEGA